jgi:hypothetical protein
MSDRESTTAHGLVCAECGTVAKGDATGWRWIRIDGEDEPPQLALFCRRCAEREFGSY